jgi:hypothetical protein
MVMDIVDILYQIILRTHCLIISRLSLYNKWKINSKIIRNPLENLLGPVVVKEEEVYSNTRLEGLEWPIGLCSKILGVM